MDANERRARARSEAAAWLLEIQAQDTPRERREEFVDWLRDSRVHVAEMLYIAQIHGALEQFEDWAAVGTAGSEHQGEIIDFPASFREISPLPLDSEKSSSSAHSGTNWRQRRMRFVAGIAASVLLAISCAWLVWNLNVQTIETARGERRDVALADGSVLQVDPETRLRVELKEKTRRVVLQRGRALFRVAKDPQRPFIVQANSTIVRAVGTTFAVEHEQQGITVTVAEGRVAVSALPPANGRHAGAAFAAMLGADEQMTLASSGSPGGVRKIDIDRELAWTMGRLAFNDTTVAQALADFNRYNRVQFRVADDALAARRVSGIFDASDPDSFIAFLRAMVRVDVVRDDNQNITIVSAP